MPPKGSAQPRSKRYTSMLDGIRDKREEAKKLLKDLRATKRNEDRRHGRLMKSAKQLSSKDLMEIAALKHFSESDLMKFADEMGITRTSICNGGAQADEGHAPASASGMIRDAPHEEPPEEHAPEPAESRVMQAEDLEALR